MLSLLLAGNILGISAGVFFLSIALTLLAVALLLWLWRWPAEKKGTIKYDILKDSALAFLTAVLVTAIYSSVLEFRRVEDIFNLIIGSDVPDEVINVAKEEVFKRRVFRENAELRFIIVRDNTLPPNQLLVKLQIDYDIFSLKPHGDDKYVFTQELEHFNMWNPESNLPRFDKIVIGDDPPYEGERLQSLVKNGSFTSDTPKSLNYWPKEPGARAGRGLHITTRRTEVIYVPGSYHTVMGELTKGAKIYIEAPDDISHELKNWFVRMGPDFKRRGEYNQYDDIVLPGQGLTIQFSKKTDAKATPASATAPSNPVKPQNTTRTAR